MDRAYIVKGVNPVGRIVEMRLVAPSAVHARRQAEEAGLRFVVVGDALDQDVRASPPHDQADSSPAPDAPPPATGG